VVVEHGTRSKSLGGGGVDDPMVLFPTRAAFPVACSVRA
jgi:hypothetical protein